MIIKKYEEGYFRATEGYSLNLEKVKWSSNVQQAGDPTHRVREFLMQEKRKRTIEKINLNCLKDFQSFDL